MGFLKDLSLSQCSSLSILPDSLAMLAALIKLDLSDCSNLSALPESLGQLNALKELSLTGCSSLSGLPESLGQLSALNRLDLSGCSKLSGLPESLGQVRALQSLRGCGSLAGVSEEVCKASSPEEAAAIFLKQDAERRMSMDASAEARSARWSSSLCPVVSYISEEFGMLLPLQAV